VNIAPRHRDSQPGRLFPTTSSAGRTGSRRSVTGPWLGRIPIVRAQIELVLIGIVVLSTVPPLVNYME
jgi:hypothetical protein